MHAHVYTGTQSEGHAQRQVTQLLMRLLHSCSWRMTVSTLLCVLRSVAKVHSLGISHGDIAPRNIFISDAGRAVLGDFDFGVVKVCFLLLSYVIISDYVICMYHAVRHFCAFIAQEFVHL